MNTHKNLQNHNKTNKAPNPTKNQIKNQAESTN